MKAREVVRILGVLLVLVVSVALAALPARAQAPIELQAVEPSEGYAGQELELTLWGRGFSRAQEVRVNIRGIEVLDARMESDEALKVYIFIPDHAPPGPRPVEVAASFGPNEVFTAALDQGFWVLERAAEPASPTAGETQGVPVVDGVEPQRVQRGSQLELNVFGRDFSPEAWVEIRGDGVYVHEVEFISREHLRASIEVDEEAAVGWREVVVINPGDQVGGRQHALEVVGEVGPSAPATPFAPSPTPTPPPAGGGLSPLSLAGAAAVLLGLGVTLGRALTLRAQPTWKDTAQLQWQLEAKTELPEPKQACTWACKAEATTDLLKRWKVAALELTPFPLPSGDTPAVKRVEGEVLDRLSEAVHPLYILEDEARTRQRVSPVLDSLLEQIVAWQEEGQTPASFRVDARLARDVKCQFKLYHCEKADAKLDWVDHGMEWKRTLHQPGGKYLGVLRGPTAGEPDFSSRAREELEGFLLHLIKGVRFRP